MINVCATFCIYLSQYPINMVYMDPQVFTYIYKYTARAFIMSDSFIEKNIFETFTLLPKFYFT